MFKVLVGYPVEEMWAVGVEEGTCMEVSLGSSTEVAVSIREKMRWSHRSHSLKSGPQGYSHLRNKQ